MAGGCVIVLVATIIFCSANILRYMEQDQVIEDSGEDEGGQV